MNTLTKAQKKAFIKIIHDIIKQAREFPASEFKVTSTKRVIMSGHNFQYSIYEITREALENFEDELGEGAP